MPPIMRGHTARLLATLEWKIQVRRRGQAHCPTDVRLRLRTGGNTYTTATASHGTVLVLPELANLAYFVGNLATRALLDLAASADSHDPQPAARFAELETTIAKDPANNIHRSPSFFVALCTGVVRPCGVCDPCTGVVRPCRYL